MGQPLTKGEVGSEIHLISLPEASAGFGASHPHTGLTSKCTGVHALMSFPRLTTGKNTGIF